MNCLDKIAGGNNLVKYLLNAGNKLLGMAFSLFRGSNARTAKNRKASLAARNVSIFAGTLIGPPE